MNFYHVLGVDPDASEEAVRRAFREQARRYHPDVNDHPRAGEQFTVLTTARDVLVDDAERAAYDRLGHEAYVSQRLDGGLPGLDVDLGSSDGAGASAGSTGDTAGEKVAEAADSAGAGTASPGVTGSRDDANGDEAAGRSSGDGGTVDRTAGSAASRSASVGDAAGDPAAGTGAGRTTSDAAGTGGRNAGRTSNGGAARDGPPRDGSAPSGTGSEAPWAVGASSGGATGAGEAAGGAATGEATALGHLSASVRWPAVLVGGAVYGYGLAGYVRTGLTGLRRAADAAAAGDPRPLLATLRSDRLGVADPLAYVDGAGLLAGVHPTTAALFAGGAVLLPLAMAYAVAGCRRRTTWRPTWLYVLASLGPAAALALAFAAARYPARVHLAVVPLWADAVLLVVLPALALPSFLFGRLVGAMPLRRREDLFANS